MRLEHGTDIGLRGRFPVGDALVDPRVDPRSFLKHFGEKSQLPGRAGGLAVDAAGKKAGLGDGAFLDLGGDAFDLSGDRAQKLGPVLAAGFSIRGEGRLRQLHGAIDFFFIRGVESRFQLLAGGRIFRVKSFAAAAAARGADERIAFDSRFHITWCP